MVTSIPSANIGKFRTLEQARAYQTALSIKKDVERAAMKLFNLDESDHDLNKDSLNFVLVSDVVQKNDGARLSGFAEFEHGQAEVKNMIYQESFGKDTEVYLKKAEQSPNGEMTYQDSRGAVTIMPDGSLFMDTDPPAIVWE